VWKWGRGHTCSEVQYTGEQDGEVDPAAAKGYSHSALRPSCFSINVRNTSWQHEPHAQEEDSNNGKEAG